MSDTNFSIIIPVFNANTSLQKLVEELVNFFQKRSSSFEIIIVDDNPSVANSVLLNEIKKLFPREVKIISLTKNFGQHNATICGFEQAVGIFIITMDDDLQHQPAEIEKLIAHQAAENFDVVYGKYAGRSHSFFRNATSFWVKKLFKIAVPDLCSDYTSFRLIKQQIAKETLAMNNSYTFLDGYISWITTHVSATEVQHHSRMEGESSYTTAKLIRHTFNILFTFSSLPIRLVTLISVFIFGSASAYAAYILVRKFYLDDFKLGFPTLAIMGAMGIGLVLFTLSIIGEYIYRINLKTTRKPNYIIKKEKG